MGTIECHRRDLPQLRRFGPSSRHEVVAEQLVERLGRHPHAVFIDVPTDVLFVLTGRRLAEQVEHSARESSPAGAGSDAPRLVVDQQLQAVLVVIEPVEDRPVRRPDFTAIVEQRRRARFAEPSELADLILRRGLGARVDSRVGRLRRRAVDLAAASSVFTIST